MVSVITHRTTILAKPNYAFEKRQRELEKKKKKEAKAQRKHEPGQGDDAPQDNTNAAPIPAQPPAMPKV
jgi:hypothetical protein